MSKMAPKKGSTTKLNPNQESWEWVDKLEEPLKSEFVNSQHIHQVYRLDALKCENGACRVNCKKNPSCHNCLGERFWKGEINDNFWIDMEDPSKQRKEKGSHVGLKNLGATCYVNTFLQLWFHNPDFRSAIFKWIPSEGYQFISEVPENQEHFSSSKDIEDDQASKKENIQKDEFPVLKTLPAPTFGTSVADNICGNLQLLFAFLKHSEKKFVDPTPLVQSLGLQTDEQQDAQEFSKLFMSLLESTLANQHVSVRGLVQDQFGGKYAYETRCTVCGKVSKTESNFYELDLNIQGHLMLKECIKEFLKEEKLDGDNRYYCTSCELKQDATRKIVLQSLPPVLNLQLLRFVFDRNTGSKRKCNSVIRFPEKLDMNECMKFQDPSKGIYELKAVLIHCGLSASSGHYVAHILDKKDDAWYRFNDEVVEKMTGRKLQLGTEEDPEDGGKSSKKGKTPKGYHNSKNAYMLVYSRKGDENKASFDHQPPVEIQEYIATNDSLFEAWILEVQILMEKKIEEGRLKRSEILDTYDNLQPSTVENSEWIPSDWLRKWLNEKQPRVPPIDNTVLMCEHGRFDPCKVQLSKRISKYSADQLFHKYGGLSRLRSDTFCIKCVFNRAKRIQFETRIEKDRKVISATNKPLISAGIANGFWVGRSSLKQWKQLAIKAQKLDSTEDNAIISDKRQPSPNSISQVKEDVSGQSNKEVLEEANILKSNEETQKNYHLTQTDGKGISKRKAKEDLDSKHSKIPKVENDERVLTEGKEDHPNEGNDTGNESSFHGDSPVNARLFNAEIVCPEHGNLCIDESKRRLVSNEVWNCLKYYFKDCPEFHKTAEPCVSCKEQNAKKKEWKEEIKALAHEMKNALTDLYHFASRPKPSKKNSFEVYAISRCTLDEWKQFIRSPRLPPYNKVENIFLFCDHERLIYSADDFLSSEPNEDYVLLSAEEWKSLSSFVGCDHEIKLVNHVTENEQNTLKISQDCCDECRSKRIIEEQELSSQFFNAPIYVRKVTNEEQQSIEIGGDISFSEDIEVLAEQSEQKSSQKGKFQEPAAGRRKSSRHRTQRGEYMFRVDSSQTLKDVKVQLISVFSVIPCDQHLSLLNGVALEDDSKTLVELGIRPGSVLSLQVDEPGEEATVPEEVNSNGDRKLEEGFKGTGLCGVFQSD